MDRESSIYGTLPLEPFLQRGSRIAQADSQVRAVQASITAAERQVAADAVHAFYRVALAQAAAWSDARQPRRDRSSCCLSAQPRAQGAAPEGDLIRAEVERDRADAELTMADVELLRAQAALRPTSARPVRIVDVRVTAPDWAAGKVTLAPMAEFTTHALSQRADLVAGRARTEAASEALALERSMVVRQLGASFGMKRVGRHQFDGGRH
jgi:outer membrane protein TolC